MPQLFDEGERYRGEQVEKFVESLLTKTGLPSEDAALTARTLVEANLRGVDSHGISRVGIYVERIQKGLANATTHVTTISDAGACALLDANNGVGQVVAIKAMELAIEKARRYGVGVIGVRNNNHIGALAYYPMMAAEQEMIGFAAANGGPAMAPWGSVTPFFGPNPFSIAFPGGEEDPVVVDMATSVVARGNIILAAKKGMKVPLGWAIGANGKPTEDPEEALKGLVLPMGGYKGYAIATAIDILVGILTGGAFGPGVGNLYKDMERSHEGGNLFGAIDIGRFVSLGTFRSRVDEMVRSIHSSTPADGVNKIFVPGEIEMGRRQERLSRGIPLDASVVEELTELGKAFSLPFPSPIRSHSNGH